MHSTASGTAAVLQRALDWWHGARSLWARADHIERMTPDEIARMAGDIGISSEEFVRVVAQPGGSADLLHRRLEALDLEAADIVRLSPLLLADLERTCACCADRERCAADMAEDPGAPGWESYCPNSGTLKTLS